MDLPRWLAGRRFGDQPRRRFDVGRAGHLWRSGDSAPLSPRATGDHQRKNADVFVGRRRRPHRRPARSDRPSRQRPGAIAGRTGRQSPLRQQMAQPSGPRRPSRCRSASRPVDRRHSRSPGKPPRPDAAAGSLLGCARSATMARTHLFWPTYQPIRGGAGQCPLVLLYPARAFYGWVWLGCCLLIGAPYETGHGGGTAFGEALRRHRLSRPRPVDRCSAGHGTGGRPVAGAGGERTAKMKRTCSIKLIWQRTSFYSTAESPVPESEQFQFVDGVLRTPEKGDARLCLPLKAPKF